MARKGYYIKDQYATYFLTFTIVGWVDIFTRPQCQQIVIDSLQFCKSNKGLKLHGYVIMSNHLHLMARIHPEHKGMSAFICDFKKFTARALIQWTMTSALESRRHWMSDVFNSFGAKNSNNETFQVWNRDNRPILITDLRAVRRILNYIHMNPVKAGIVTKPEDYLLSSARNYAGRNDYLIEVEKLQIDKSEFRENNQVKLT